jgi:head-tail adaptor
LRSNRYRHKILIQAATTARDSYGEAIKTWANLAAAPDGVMADIQTGVTPKRYEANQYVGRATHTVYCRPVVGVKSGARVLRGSTVYDVLGVSMPESYRHPMAMLVERIE